MKPSVPAMAIMALLLVASGCTNAIKKISELGALRNKIYEEYHEDVNVTLYNNALVVTFINSELNSQSVAERQKRAAQTAKFVVKNFPAMDEIRLVWIGFAKQETHYVLVHYSQSLGVFGFDKTGQPLSKPPPPYDPLKPVATYSQQYDATEISIQSIQLQQQPHYDFSATVYFTVKGDAVQSLPSKTQPAEVFFDFSSNSEKSLFPGEPKILFSADNNVVFEQKKQFSTSKYEETYSEALTLPVPFHSFQQIANAKQVTLKIGDRIYEFTPEQIAALHEMATYVGE